MAHRIYLANHLGVPITDFVVLEGHEEIAPQVGARIALFPNRARILDQLGMWNYLKQLITPLRRTHFRDADGQTLLKFGGGQMLEACYHYPSTFLDRQLLLQVLYNHVKDKSKVLAGHRVADIKHSEQGVEVTTKNGKTFKGDIVIGADGVHSTVRHLMHKISDNVQPGYIPEDDKTAMSAEYCCIFGISEPVDGYLEGNGDPIFNDLFSVLTGTGLGGRLFWFVFIKMEKKYFAPNIPRFIKADCEKMAPKFFKASITEKETFEDIWESRISDTLTSLEERITPNEGQGGNSCIESVAEFNNILNRTLSKEKSGNLSSEKIIAVFQEFYESRMQRVKQVFDVSARVTRLQARDGLKWKLFEDFVLPYLSEEYVMQDTVN
ncbi:hypothetical protein RUND412_010351 [Rhizina undulata]